MLVHVAGGALSKFRVRRANSTNGSSPAFVLKEERNLPAAQGCKARAFEIHFDILPNYCLSASGQGGGGVKEKDWPSFVCSKVIIKVGSVVVKEFTLPYCTILTRLSRFFLNRAHDRCWRKPTTTLIPSRSPAICAQVSKSFVTTKQHAGGLLCPVLFSLFTDTEKLRCQRRILAMLFASSGRKI